MRTYIICAILVVLGGIGILAGVLMGVSAPANYAVEAGFGAIALAGAFFVLSVLAGLVKEFQQTA
ncbi:MAG: hypothetical protein U1E28_06775 [Beijerinckiaceae bacterium]